MGQRPPNPGWTCPGAGQVDRVSGGLLARALVRWGLPCSQSCEPRCHPGKTRETLEPCEQAGSPGNWLGPWAGRWRAIKEKSPRRRLQRRGGSGDITAKALADPFCRKPAREIPPMAKVMRKSSVGQRRDQASREPPGPSQASTPKPESVCLTML